MLQLNVKVLSQNDFRRLSLQALALTVSQPIVVEPTPHQGSAADFPILIIFKHSHLSLFHLYVVVY